MRRLILWVLLALCAPALAQQTFISPVLQNARSTGNGFGLPIGTSLPASCSVGMTFFKTDATAGANIYQCATPNTWTAPTLPGGTGVVINGTDIVTGTNSAVLFQAANKVSQDGASFLYDATNKRLFVGSSDGANAGIALGHGSFGYGAIYTTGVTPGAGNWALATNGTNTYINATDNIYFTLDGTAKVTLDSIGGKGLYITAGTVIGTAVSALLGTQTWNYSLDPLTGIKFTFTDTSSHADTLALQLLCGAAGTTNCFSVDKHGAMRSGGKTVGGLPTAGVPGRRLYVTDQLTACPAPGVALTGGGGVTCSAFDNGSAWVGG